MSYLRDAEGVVGWREQSWLARVLKMCSSRWRVHRETANKLLCITFKH